MRMLRLLLGAAVLFSFLLPAVAQRQGERQLLGKADAHPELSVGLSESAKAKVVFAQKNYRLGELVKLNVAVLLSNTREYYFPSEFDYQISVRTLNGKPVTVKPIYNIDGAPVYEKVSNTLLTRSTYLILGCQTPTLVNFRRDVESVDLDSPVAVFDKNLFAPPAEYCIDVAQQQVLDVSVVVSNKSVVSSQNGDSTQTMVGAIRASSVRMRVLE